MFRNGLESLLFDMVSFHSAFKVKITSTTTEGDFLVYNANVEQPLKKGSNVLLLLKSGLSYSDAHLNSNSTSLTQNQRT